MRRHAFTMIELVFVIVVMGILGKFGVEFLMQAYRSFIYSEVNHNLQSNSEIAVESIASRLQFRIKDSIIGRIDSNNSFEALASIDSAHAEDYTILEWIGSDVEGFRGSSMPYWSGIIDLNDSNATLLVSPETNTTAENNLISILSNGGSDINDSAIYFIGSNNNIQTGYDWNGSALTDQSGVMHPIRQDTNISKFVPVNGSTGADNNFSGVDVYEYYQLAWSAYAVKISDYNNTTHMGTLKLYYNYQPWQGERYTDGNSSVIMNNVSTFRFRAVGSVVKVQVCVKSEIIDGTNDEDGYSLCKEKTVF